MNNARTRPGYLIVPAKGGLYRALLWLPDPDRPGAFRCVLGPTGHHRYVEQRARRALEHALVKHGEPRER